MKILWWLKLIILSNEYMLIIKKEERKRKRGGEKKCSLKLKTINTIPSLKILWLYQTWKGKLWWTVINQCCGRKWNIIYVSINEKKDSPSLSLSLFIHHIFLPSFCPQCLLNEWMNEWKDKFLVPELSHWAFYPQLQWTLDSVNDLCVPFMKKVCKYATYWSSILEHLCMKSKSNKNTLR